MNILVTGGCGFIGSHLADRLVEQKHDVTILDNLSTGQREHAPRLARLIEGNVADEGLVEHLVRESNAVFHLAAIASVQVCEEQPELAANTNVLGTQLIFMAAATKQIPVIYASSAAVYGDNPALPLSEEATPAPLGNYGRHKLENERIAARTDTPSVGLRFFNVYGSRQDPRSPYSGVISKFVERVRAEEVLTFFGDGKQTRDFIHVSDIVELLIKAWENAGTPDVFNGCTGRQTSLIELAEAIGAATGKDLLTEFASPRSGDIRHSLGDPAKAQAKLGFVARTGLVEGLRELA